MWLILLNYFKSLSHIRVWRGSVAPPSFFEICIKCWSKNWRRTKNVGLAFVKHYKMLIQFLWKMYKMSVSAKIVVLMSPPPPSLSWFLRCVPQLHVRLYIDKQTKRKRHAKEIAQLTELNANPRVDHAKEYSTIKWRQKKGTNLKTMERIMDNKLLEIFL